MTTSCINKLFVVFFLVFSLVGCKEVYDPEISPSGGGIAVEGLITTAPGPYIINLSLISGFYSNRFAPPLAGATVWVEDETGERHNFSEVSEGRYESPASMRGREGGVYTLYFETTDGHAYSSTPQKMIPAYEIDSMLAEPSSHIASYESNSGRLIIREMEGVDAILTVNNPGGNPANIRFGTEVKLLYSYQTMRAGIPANVYCHIQHQRMEGIENMNLPAFGNRPGDVSNNVVAFLPFDKTEYRIREDAVVNLMALKVNLYSINQEAYAFYHDVHQQMTSDGSIFAPVAAQMTGNISCMTDPDRIAVGLFEASSVTSRVFRLLLPPNADVPGFIPYSQYDEIPPGQACSIDIIPPYWVN